MDGNLPFDTPDHDAADTDAGADENQIRARGVDEFVNEARVNAAADDVVNYAHQQIRIGRLSPAESRLAWVTVIHRMVQSVWVDARNDALKEELRSGTGR
jgi:hypothetical protein